LYWLVRMLESGEDPLYIARRMVRMASEDIGLAEPGALAVTIAAMQAADFVGPPEGNLALAQAAVIFHSRQNQMRCTPGTVRSPRTSMKQGPNPCRCICATRPPV